MKVALCLSGLLRDYKAGWKTGIDPTFGHYNPDLYVSVWDDIGYWAPGDSVGNQGFHKTSTVTKQELCDFYKTDNVILENFDSVQPILDEYTKDIPEFYIEEIKHSNFMARRINTASLFYKKKSVVDMVTGSGKEYDLVIRTRPDIQFSRSIKVPDSTNFYVLPGSNHLGKGINDNLQISSMSNIQKYAEVYDRLHELFYWKDSKIYCPHTFASNILEINGINRVTLPVTFALLHAPGGAYHTLDAKSRKWKPLNQAEYEKQTGRFKG